MRKKTLYNPVFKKIEYYLYNYDYIDIKISNIEDDILNYDYNQNYYKWIKNKSSSLEDQVIRNIGIEQRIYKLKKWKHLISFVLKWYEKNNIVNYYFIRLKYFKKANFIKIHEKLNLSLKEQKDIQAEILQYIFFVAIKKGMLKKEVNY